MTSKEPSSGVQRAWTVISFLVSVPVLSEQTTRVLPRVSTAGRRRMIAWRRAMRRTPMAMAMVMIAGRPSGLPHDDLPIGETTHASGADFSSESRYVWASSLMNS